jgi:hypothetical protein
MTKIIIRALLPARDGTGWYAVQLFEPTYRCSIKSCDNEAVAYHHATYGTGKVWRNRYRCTDHLPLNVEVRDGRVWLDSSVDPWDREELPEDDE